MELKLAEHCLAGDIGFERTEFDLVEVRQYLHVIEIFLDCTMIVIVTQDFQNTILACPAEAVIDKKSYSAQMGTASEMVEEVVM